MRWLRANRSSPETDRISVHSTFKISQLPSPFTPHLDSPQFFFSSLPLLPSLSFLPSFLPPISYFLIINVEHVSLCSQQTTSRPTAVGRSQRWPPWSIATITTFNSPLTRDQQGSILPLQTCLTPSIQGQQPATSNPNDYERGAE